MHCREHPEREAIAVCRMCGRGLCVECGQPVGRGFACRGECADLGKDYEGLIREAVDHFRKRRDQQLTLSGTPGDKALPPGSPRHFGLTQTNAPRTTTVEFTAAHSEATPSVKQSSMLRKLGIFNLVLGCALLGWGFLEPERFMVVLLLGVASLVSGTFALLHTR